MKLSDITNTPTGCTCEVEEIVSSVDSSVKGYRVSQECTICSALRATQSAAYLQQQLEDRISFLQNKIVQLSTEKDKATSLGFTDLAAQKQTELTALSEELATLVES